MSESKVPLLVSNQKAYVWDVNDIDILRSKYHISGTLVGTLPHLSQQNVFLGVPLVLLPEEVVLLVNKHLPEFAVLVDDPQAHRSPSSQALQRWNSDRLASVNQQILSLEAKEIMEKEESTGRAMSEKALLKRQEREARRAAASQKAPESDSIHVPSLPVEPESQLPIPQAMAPPASLSMPAYTIIVPGSSTILPWYNPNAHAYSTIEAAQTAGIWSYPSTLADRAKCAVFQDLWEKNYFMGGGIKFGGDFLVYPGDPLRYHSHFTASVVESPNLPIRPMEIVAHGRLGTATKKNHLLCTWDEEKEKVSYVSIEWAGFG